MKKMIALLLALVMVLCLTACGGSEPAPELSNQPVPTAAPAPVENEDSEETVPTTEYVPVIDRAAGNTWDATAEIAAIAPVSGIYSQNVVTYKPNFDYLVCRCITTEGGMAYVYLTVDDYLQTFDAEANVSSTHFAYSEMVVFEKPMHIDGTYMTANSIVEGLADTIESEKVIHLGDVSASAATVNEVDYTADVAAMTCAKATIVSIVPSYTLTGGSALSTTDVVCSAELADGNTIWIAMSVEDYNAHFDPDASLAFSTMASFETVTFEGGLTIHGVAISTDSVANGLADATGSATVFYFARKG